MAKSFKFTLEPVLEQRKRVEDERQQIVARHVHALQQSEADLKRLNDEFRAGSDRMRAQHDALSGEDLRLHYAHLQFLDRAITAQIRVVAERRVAVDRARNDLLAATKERKAVEKLKERRHAAFLAEAIRIEQNELDDGNARRFGRASLGGML